MFCCPQIFSWDNSDALEIIVRTKLTRMLFCLCSHAEEITLNPLYVCDAACTVSMAVCVYICLYFVYIYMCVCVCACMFQHIFSIANLYRSFTCMRVCSTVSFAHGKTSIHNNNSEVLKYLGFTQQYWWGFSSCGMCDALSLGICCVWKECVAFTFTTHTKRCLLLLLDPERCRHHAPSKCQ